MAAAPGGAARKESGLRPAQPSFQAVALPIHQSATAGGGAAVQLPHKLFGPPTERGVNHPCNEGRWAGQGRHFGNRKRAPRRAAPSRMPYLNWRSALGSMLNASSCPPMAIRELLEGLPSMNHRSALTAWLSLACHLGPASRPLAWPSGSANAPLEEAPAGRPAGGLDPPGEREISQIPKGLVLLFHS